MGAEVISKQFVLSDACTKERTVEARNRSAFIRCRLGWLSILLVGLLSGVAALGQDAGSNPEITEHNDAVLHRRVFELRRPARLCTGTAVLSYVCWEIYPRAWQSLDKKARGIELLINIWQNGTSRQLSMAGVTIGIDGQVKELTNVLFQPGTYSFEGVTATLKDEELVRDLAAASHVWITVEVKPILNVVLTQEMLTSINTLLEKYTTLDVTGGRLEAVNTKLAALVLELRGYDQQWRDLQQGVDGCKGETCLLQEKKMVASVLKCQGSIGMVLDEKVALLRTHGASPSDQNASVERRRDLIQSMQRTRAVQAQIDKQLSETAKSKATSGRN